MNTGKPSEPKLEPILDEAVPEALKQYASWLLADPRTLKKQTIIHGRRTKAANSRRSYGGHPTYGYRKAGQGRNARLVVDGSKAKIVRRIFALFAGPDDQPSP